MTSELPQDLRHGSLDATSNSLNNNALSNSWQKLGNRLRNLWRDDAIRTALIVFVALRLLTGAVALIQTADLGFARPSLLEFNSVTRRGNASGETYAESLPMDSPLARIVAPWRLYDTAWYIKIAIQGYRPDNGIVFPPLYPILIRAVVPFVGGNWVLSSLIVSNIACLIMFVLLYKLVMREYADSGLATRTLILTAAFPTSYYLMAGYTEPVYMAFTLGALLAAFNRRWWLTGTLAFLASLTRLQGIVLCLPLAWIAYVELRESGLRPILTRVPAVAGAALGTASYYAYVAINNLGSFEERYNDGWSLTTRLPFSAFAKYFERVFTGQAAPHENGNFIIIVVMVVLGIVVLRKMKPVYSLYTWATLIGLLMRYHYGEALAGAQFESMIRYVLMLFPCFIAGAMLIRERWQVIAYTVLSGLWQVSLLYSFNHWIWVA